MINWLGKLALTCMHELKRGSSLDADDFKRAHPLPQIYPFHYCSNQTAQEGSNLFGQDNMNYPILETYAEGSVMEVKVVVSTYHWVSLCCLCCPVLV